MAIMVIEDEEYSTNQYAIQSGSSSGFFGTYPLGRLLLSSGGIGLSPSSTP